MSYLLTEIEISRIGQRIIDELIQPLRGVQLDEHEYACLKAIVFFDPGKPKKNFLKFVTGHIVHHNVSLSFLPYTNPVVYQYLQFFVYLSTYIWNVHYFT